MKRMLSFAVALAATLCAPVHADRGDQYLLGKVGIMTVDKNNADPLFSFGALYGYGITPDITAEAELNLAFIGGEYSNSKNNDSGEYDVWSAAGYAVYRLPIQDNLYGKAKGGLIFEHVARSGDKTDSSGFAMGISGGVGIGYVLNELLTIEGEITGLDKDIFFFSIGANYAFR